MQSEQIQTQSFPGLPHFVLDNLPCKCFEQAVDCSFLGADSVAAHSFVNTPVKNMPDKVLIDAREMSPLHLNAILATLMKAKQAFPEKSSVVITHNMLPSRHGKMSVFQHVYTVGLKSAKCKIWHDPPSALPSSQPLSSIFKGSIAGANASILLDTGAGANCISAEFCRLMRLEIK